MGFGYGKLVEKVKELAKKVRRKSVPEESGIIELVKAKKYVEDVSRMSGVEIAMVFDLMREDISEKIGFDYSNKRWFVRALSRSPETSKMIDILLELYKKDAPNYLRKLDRDRKWVLAYELACF